MTHEQDVDDGDLEIEAWEQADAVLAADGMSEEDRRTFWEDMKSHEAVEAESFLRTWADSRGVSLAEAHRQIYELNGVVL